jgi:hypothetical protein
MKRCYEEIPTRLLSSSDFALRACTGLPREGNHSLDARTSQEAHFFAPFALVFAPFGLLFELLRPLSLFLRQEPRFLLKKRV